MDHLHRCRAVLGAIASAVDMLFGSATTVLAQGGFDCNRPSIIIVERRIQAHRTAQSRRRPYTAPRRLVHIGCIERAAATAAARQASPPPRMRSRLSRGCRMRVSGQLHDRLHKRTSGAARPLAGPFQWRRGRCFWCWPARRLERCRKSSTIFGRHRRQHGGADGALYLCRAAL